MAQIKNKSSILVLGSGAWGTALSNVLLKNKHDVYIYSVNKQEQDDLSNQVNTKYFGAIKLYAKPKLVSDNIQQLLDLKPQYILLAVPSAFLMSVLELTLNKLCNSNTIFINVAKGLNEKTNCPWSKDIKKAIGKKARGLVTMIGPSFATEVFKNEITIINSISEDKTLANKVAKLFNNDTFKCVSITDETGAEMCAALKNVMAIALGMTYQMHTSINTRAALLTQAVKEVAYIIKKMHGENSTILNFCGIGDIFLTCTDEKSRNFSFGQDIALHGAKEAISNITKNNITVEGFKTLKTAKQIVDTYRVDCPLIEALYKVVFENKNPHNFVEEITKQLVK